MNNSTHNTIILGIDLKQTQEKNGYKWLAHIRNVLQMKYDNVSNQMIVLSS